MRYLFVLLVLCTVAILVAAIAMWWRLRRHLRKSDEALERALRELESESESEHEPEHETVEQ